MRIKFVTAGIIYGFLEPEQGNTIDNKSTTSSCINKLQPTTLGTPIYIFRIFLIYFSSCIVCQGIYMCPTKKLDSRTL